MCCPLFLVSLRHKLHTNMTFKLLPKLLCLSVAILIGTTNLFAWGQKGHDTTCEVAERHLTKKAKKKIAEIFDGKSIVYWANWMDNASNQDEFRYTKTWHYKNIDPDETYETAQENENGDVQKAIEAQIAALKSGTLNKEAAEISLRMLVHLVGDLHCPMHMGHRSDSGGNRHQVQFFNEGTNLHSVWDSKMLERAHNWTYTEWANQIDRADKKTVKALQQGSVADWGKQTYQESKKVYDNTPIGTKISYNEVAYWTPLIEQQLFLGGIRLAAVLNDIFK